MAKEEIYTPIVQFNDVAAWAVRSCEDDPEKRTKALVVIAPVKKGGKYYLGFDGAEAVDSAELARLRKRRKDADAILDAIAAACRGEDL